MRQKIGKLFERPEHIFITLALISGVFSAILVPQLIVTDESSHFLRSYNLASGDLGNEKCYYPTDIVNKTRATKSGEYTEKFSQKTDASHVVHGGCGSAASYSPIMHLPQALGVLIAKTIYPSAALMVLFGRLANLIFYVGALYFIIKKVRIGKWAFTVVGLFPTMIHLAASLSGDVMNNVVVLAYSAFLFNLFTQRSKLSRKHVVLLLSLSCLLALTKFVNILLLLPVLFLPGSLFTRDKFRYLPLNPHKWILAACCGILGLISFYVWGKVYGGSLVSSTVPNPLIHHPFHFLQILYNTYINGFLGYNDVVLRGTFGDFASFKYHLPTFMLMLVFFIFVVTLLRRDKKEEAQLPQKTVLPLVLSSSSAFVLLFLAITYAMYVTWAILPTRLGPGALYADGVQGRYFTASLVMLIPLSIYLRRYINFNISSERAMSVLVSCFSGLALVYYVVESAIAFN